MSIQICRKKSLRKWLCKKLTLRSLLYTFVFTICWFMGVLTKIIELFDPEFNNDGMNVIHTFLSISQPFWIAVVFIPAENVFVEIGFWSCLKSCCQKCKKKKKNENEEKEELLKSELKEPLIEEHSHEEDNNDSFALDLINKMDELEPEPYDSWMKSNPENTNDDDENDSIQEHFEKPKYGGKIQIIPLNKENEKENNIISQEVL